MIHDPICLQTVSMVAYREMLHTHPEPDLSKLAPELARVRLPALTLRKRLHPLLALLFGGSTTARQTLLD